jgi:sugar lactone lactonase YvrE
MPPSPKVFILSVLCAISSASQVITTVAGTDWIFSDDGRAATESAIGRIISVATDFNGKVYLGDVDNSQVYTIDPVGTIKVLAGNGIPGLSGIGGPARSAALRLPEGIAVDRKGNVYVALTASHRVFRVATNGNLVSFAGTGTPGFGGDGGAATNALLRSPKGLALDAADNLYIADAENNRVRRVSADGRIDTVAGDGQARFQGDGGKAVAASLSTPTGVALDANGDLLIADTFNHRVRRVSLGVISTVAGTSTRGFSGDGGIASEAALDRPMALAADGINIYIADAANHRIRIVSKGIINTFAGTGAFELAGDGGPATSASLNFPSGVALDASGNLFIADFQNSRVRRVNPSGNISSIAGSGRFRLSDDGISGTTSVLSIPTGIAIDSQGSLFLTENQRARVRKISPDGTVTTVAGNGFQGFGGENVPATGSTLYSPSRLAIDSNNNLFISDNAYHRIRVVTPEGLIRTVAGTGQIAFAGDGGPATSAALNQPEGVATDKQNNLYVADSLNHRIRRINPQGIISTIVGTGAADSRGDEGLATAASVNQPTGVFVDSDGNLYVAERAGNRIRKISNGIITTIAGTGQPGSAGDGGQATDATLNQPGGVVVDPDGNIFIAELVGSRIRRIAPDGKISTFAGSGALEYSGDGGLAINAGLNIPTDVRIDSSGAYIADAFNNRVRKVIFSDVSFEVTPQSLSFQAHAGGASTPTQTVGVVGSVPGLAFSASVDMDQPWLRLTRSSGTLPGNFGVSVDPSTLDVGMYFARVTVTVPAANPPTRILTFPVSIEALNPPKLGYDPNSVQLTGIESGDPVETAVLISNRGGGELSIEVNTNSTEWLSVRTTKPTVTPNSNGSVRVMAYPTGLSAGKYSANVTVKSPTTSESVDIPVTLTVLTTARPKILLSQTGLTFRSTFGGTDLDQCFAVLNQGQGQLQFTVSTDQAWLFAEAKSCPWRAVSGASNIPEVVVSIKPGTMEVGDYQGRVIVSAPTAEMSTATLSVNLRILAAGQNIGPVLRPTGLVFLAGEGVTPPGSLDINVINFSGTRFDYNTGIVTNDGSLWINRLPDRGTAGTPPATPPVIRVAVQTETLPSNNYYGTLTMNAGLFGSRTADVLLSVKPTVTAVSQSAPGIRSSLDECRNSTLSVVPTEVPSGFIAAPGFPFPIEVFVVDSCGAPLTKGAVVATMSNGDSSFPLLSLGDGRWSGTWDTLNTTDSGGVILTIRAESVGALSRGERSIEGKVMRVER